MAEGRVLVIGALHLDVIVNAPRLPGRDETLMGDSVAYRFGGKGGNQALAAARFGADVQMVGRIGKDRFGDMILATLRESGIGYDQVLRVDGASGMSVAIVEDAGDYAAVVVSGVNQAIDAQTIDIAGDKSICLLQNEIAENVNRAVVDRLPEACFLILNAAPARHVPPEVLQRTDLLIVNRVEAAQMTAVDPEDLVAERATVELSEAGARAVMVTLGPDGSVAKDAEGACWAAKAYPAKAISTHGAGDCFVGALAARLAQGEGLREAAGFAQAAAALHVSTPVAEREAIGKEHVLTFMRSGS